MSLTADIRALFSGHRFENWHGRVGPWQQVVETALRMALNDASGDVGEIGVRLDADELAGLDQRGDHRPVFAPGVRAGEQRVFAVQGQGPDRSLDHIGVDLDPAVVEEQAQACPARQGVADRIGELAFAADEPELLAQPRIQRIDQRLTALLACGTPFPGRATTNVGLDPVERCDARQRLCGDRRGGGEFVEGATDMAPQ